MSASDRFLVIGGNSLLGGKLLHRWQLQGREVLATTRRPAAPGTEWLHLDLAEPLDDWTAPFSGGVAVVCAASTNQEECRRNPAATRQINVKQTIQLARQLIAEDWFLVFLSTSVVFDGKKPARRTDEPVSPMTEYGRQKAEVETALLELAPRAAIVRLGKVVHRDLAVFRTWDATLSASRVINPFSDYVCSPIRLDQATDVVGQIAERRLEGIWHASAKDEATYAEIARVLARKGGYPEELVRPMPAPAGLLEHLPIHSGLEVSQTEKALGITFPSCGQLIDTL
jgi:dTDP-4-dehydrorhamnose reductase